jgi:nicotinate-nucleotide pyrophosphorylase (carboxylating)
LAAVGLDAADVVAVIDRAVAEDLGTTGDLTSTATIDAGATMTARYVSRGSGVVAGLPVVAAAAEHLFGADVLFQLLAADGDRVQPGDALAEIGGPARAVLGFERLSLNLLGHLSGIASQTRAWVDAVAGSGSMIRDTRKTTPGLRDLEKYAVRCGGGVNHRRGLDDGVLIKDNHVAAAGGVGAALDRVQAAYPDQVVAIQVEVDDLDQLDEALAHGATSVLLDNFSTAELRAAVERVRDHPAGVVLEASGGLQLADAVAVAATGVHYISVGALTHSAPILDIGLDTVGPSTTSAQR